MDDSFRAACAFAKEFLGKDAPAASSEIYARKLESLIFRAAHGIPIEANWDEDQTLRLAQMAHDGDALAFDLLHNFCRKKSNLNEELDQTCRQFVAGVMAGHKKRPRHKPSLNMIRDIAIIGVIQEIVRRYGLKAQRGDETGRPCAVDAIAAVTTMTEKAVDGVYSQRNTPRSAWQKIVTLKATNAGITLKSSRGQTLTIYCK